MSRSRSYTMALAVVIVCVSSALAATVDCKSVNIPLEEIWALDTPGARDIRELDPPRESEPQSVQEFIATSLVERTAQTLSSSNWPKNGESADRGFVVAGQDVEALQEAQAVLTKKSERADFLPAEKVLTLVFYAYSCGQYVRLDGVEHDGDTIKVKYHFQAHRTLDMSSQLALIPLGKLPSGKKHVQMVRLPDTGPGSDSHPMDRGTARRIVCDSFSFGVAAAKK